MKHFESGSDENGNSLRVMIPNELITVDNGLLEPRFFVLKKQVPQKNLGAILMLQIESLQNFLNVKTKLSPDQLAETASLILSEFDDFSFTAIMDCLNRIKTSKAPFNVKLFESIDGRKILDLLQLYRDYQIEHLENKHQDTKQNSDFKFNGHNERFRKSMTELAHKLRVESTKENKAAIEIRRREKSKEELLVQDWINEFHQTVPVSDQYVGALDEFLERKMKEYNKLKK